MKTLKRVLLSVVMSWGIAAVTVAAASLFSPDRVDIRLLRIVLAEVTIVAVTAQLLFEANNWRAGLWTKRIVIMLCSSVVGIAAIVISGLRPFTWTLCAWITGLCFLLTAAAFLTADAAERRMLDRINDRLSRNK